MTTPEKMFVVLTIVVSISLPLSQTYTKNIISSKIDSISSKHIQTVKQNGYLTELEKAKIIKELSDAKVPNAEVTGTTNPSKKGDKVFIEISSKPESQKNKSIVVLKTGLAE